MAERRNRFAALVAAALAALLAGCAGDTEPAVEEDAEPAVVAPALPQTVEDIFPETGSRGLVLNRCSTCHAVACAAIGRRSEERWAAVEASHLDYVPGMSAEDRGKIFDYLKRHFNDTLPEPEVEPHLLGAGCPELSP